MSEAETIAHKWEADKPRTADVQIDQNISFSKMMLSDNVLSGLHRSGFFNPSPIQLRAIPLGRSGLDLVIQAKSGTGKTLVFGTVILERFDFGVKSPQSLVVAPTREIAVQIVDTLRAIGANTQGFKVEHFIGGLDIEDDRKKINRCTAVVGTPGRILHLINNQVINMEEIKIFVLDEADRLMSSTFHTDITTIFQKFTKKPQVLAASATYEDDLEKLLKIYMQNPIGVTPKREVPILLGIRQYYYDTDGGSVAQNNMQEMLAKVKAVQSIFSTVPFKQCIVFSNSTSRASSYCNSLVRNGWPAEVINGSQEQKTRLEIFGKFKNFTCRILVATDLMARGIDSDKVNLVINLDVPVNNAVYLHRIGRCGRFGSQGIAITLLSSTAEKDKFKTILDEIGGKDALRVIRFDEQNVEKIWNFHDSDDKCELFDIKNAINLNLKNVAASEHGEPMKQSGTIALDVINANLIDAAAGDAQIDEDLFESYSLDVNVSMSVESKYDTTTSQVEKADSTVNSNLTFLEAIARLNLYPDDNAVKTDVPIPTVPSEPLMPLENDECIDLNSNSNGSNAGSINELKSPSESADDDQESSASSEDVCPQDSSNEENDDDDDDDDDDESTTETKATINSSSSAPDTEYSTNTALKEELNFMFPEYRTSPKQQPSKPKHRLHMPNLNHSTALHRWQNQYNQQLNQINSYLNYSRAMRAGSRRN